MANGGAGWTPPPPFDFSLSREAPLPEVKNIPLADIYVCLPSRLSSEKQIQGWGSSFRPKTKYKLKMWKLSFQ